MERAYWILMYLREIGIDSFNLYITSRNYNVYAVLVKIPSKAFDSVPDTNLYVLGP